MSHRLRHVTPSLVLVDCAAVPAGVSVGEEALIPHHEVALGVHMPADAQGLVPREGGLRAFEELQGTFVVDSAPPLQFEHMDVVRNIFFCFFLAGGGGQQKV